MQKLERIPINIWDDFHEDGYVPEGEKQETYIYVEDSNIPQEKRKECLELLLSTMCGLNFVGVKMWLFFYDSRTKYPTLAEMYHFERWEIRVENLTHERLSKLLVELNSANLSVDGIPFEIYSES
mgnify:CR=1 FL=1